MGISVSENMVRVSFTVPPQVREDLGYLSGRLGVTKSAFVSLLLGEAVADLRRLMESVPEQPSDGDMLRLRGESKDLIEARIGNLQGMSDDLFSVGE